AHARHDVHAVHLVSANRDWGHIRDGLCIERSFGRTWELRAGGRLIEVIAVTGLVVDNIDHTNCVCTKRVLRNRVGISAGLGTGSLNNIDINSLRVRQALHLIERPVVRSVQCSRRTVRSDARSSRSVIDITRCLWSRWSLRRSSEDGSPGANKKEHQCKHQYKMYSWFHHCLI